MLKEVFNVIVSLLSLTFHRFSQEVLALIHRFLLAISTGIPHHSIYNTIKFIFSVSLYQNLPLISPFTCLSVTSVNIQGLRPGRRNQKHTHEHELFHLKELCLVDFTYLLESFVFCCQDLRSRVLFPDHGIDMSREPSGQLPRERFLRRLCRGGVIFTMLGSS